MTLENIVKAIKKKVSQEVEKIRQEANKEREEILRKAREEANRAKNEIISRAKEEAERERQRNLMRTRSKERKNILALKRELMDKAFAQAKEGLYSLSEEEYLEWSRKLLLSNINSGKEEIIVSPRDVDLMKEVLAEGLEKDLKIKDRNEIKFSPHLNEKEKGFIIKKEGMQINCTFSSFFSSLKNELEIEVAKRLFSF